MNCSEIQFLAENEPVSIIGTFNEEVLHLIGGDVGPFEAGVSISVPLWLAIYLKQRHKCRIVCPNWLSVDTLEQTIGREAEDPLFSAVPRHFVAIGHLLFQKAPDDIPDGNRLKTLLKDLCDSRQAKLRTSVHKFIEGQGTSAKVDHLTQMEISSYRPVLLASLDQLRSLNSAMQAVAENLPTGFN